jgi:hypothetical protein
VKFSVTHDYDHSAEEVLAALTDFDAMKAKYEALGQSSVTLVSHERKPDGAIVISTQRVVPLQVPSFAKRILSPKQSVTQIDTWSAPGPDGARTGTFKVEAKGTPVKISGTMRLAPAGEDVCTDVMDVSIDCSVPLIGGKLADFVSGDTRRALDHEHDWVTAHLSAG